MKRSLIAGLLLALATSVVPGAGSPPANAQDADFPPTCLQANELTADLGMIGQDGATVSASLGQTSDVRRFVFHLGGVQTVAVYVGDQWYDVDLAVFSGDKDQLLGCWRVSKRDSVSERSDRRVLQLIRPDDRILELLPAGDYALIVRAAYPNNPELNPGFDPAKPFTVRVASAPPACGLTPPNDEVDPQYPKLKRRRADDQSLYQLGMSYQPLLAGPFDLLTFTAYVSPPYTDLFDFSWEIDGKPVPDSNIYTIQQPVPGLAKTPSGQHTVKVTAKGARVYPDPDQPSVPLNGGSFSVECKFMVK